MSSVNRCGSTPRRPAITPIETPSSSRSSRTRWYTRGASTNGAGQNNVRESVLKALSPKHTNALLENVKAIQNRKKWELLITFHKNAVHPERISDDAFYEAGFTHSLSRSRILVVTMKENDHFFGQDGAPLGNRILDPAHIVDQLDERLPTQKKMSLQEKEGITLYLAALLQNLRELGGSIEALPQSMRPSFCYYAGFATDIRASKSLVQDMQKFGVLDHKMLPKNGDQAFNQFTTNFWVLRDYKNNPNAQVRDEAIDNVMDVLGQLREALFPLPTYTP